MRGRMSKRGVAAALAMGAATLTLSATLSSAQDFDPDFIYPRPEPRPRREPLSSEEIRAVFAEHQPELQSCLAATRSSPRVNVSVTIQVDVARSGRVTAVTVRGTRVGDLQHCIERAALTWRFPPSGRSVRIHHRIAFRGNRRAD